MMVGYIPDPFGHIGQMPQILRGFGIESACLWRGVDDQPCEFWWSAPDGSKVFMAYLRDSYGNGAGLKIGENESFVEDVCRARDSLAPHSASSHLLIMHGTDHMEPQLETSKAVSFFNSVPVTPPTQLIHSTLPQYLSDVRTELERKEVEIPNVTGELRSCEKAFLLPGVLSTRMWIKQRNHACQTVLEKWAEPFSTWASMIVESGQPSEIRSRIPSKRLANPEQVLHIAWQLLIQCHPHDSICGCSIDQVHEEMRSRFDQVEQIGEEITKQSLAALAEAIHTEPAPGVKAVGAITVFNPAFAPGIGVVTTEIQLPEDFVDFEIIDENDRVMPHQSLGSSNKPFVNMTMTPADFKVAMELVSGGRLGNQVITRFKFERQDSSVLVNITFSETGEPNLSLLQEASPRILQLLEDPSVTQFTIRGVTAAATRIAFLAQDVPGFGYRTFWIRALPIQRIVKSPAQDQPPYRIENEFFQVKVSPHEGTLNVLDKRTGQEFQGLNRFDDGGDCGDEYNYSPPETDQVIHEARLKDVRFDVSPIKQTIHLDLEMRLPLSLSQDRKTRSEETVLLPIKTSITLIPGLPRIDIHTEVDNLAEDHRLRVHFPAPFAAQLADCDGHFEVVHRPVSPTQDGNIPYPDPSRGEQPRTEMPQLAFTDITNGKDSLLIANRGLPEVAVLPNAGGCHEIALTLLRCVGYLSRDDLSTRKGHTGPDLPTPGAQLPGVHAFDYAILPHAAGDTITAYHQAYAFTAPLRSTKTTFHEGPLPKSDSMVEVNTPEFVISSIKTSEDGRGWIVRGYNVASHPVSVTLKSWTRFEKVERVNLLETPEASLSYNNQGEVTFPVSAFQIVSVKFSQ